MFREPRTEPAPSPAVVPRGRCRSPWRDPRLLVAFVACLSQGAWARATVAGEAGGPAARAGASGALEAFVDDTMRRHLDTYDIAGASVTIVGDGDVLLSKGYGFADVAARVPVEADVTLFGTASVAKLFVWTALMQLVERGELDLEAPVNDYLTRLRIPDAFGEPVRVRHLLTHTAGFEDKPVVGLLSRTAADLPELETALRRWMPKRVAPPGRYAAYSNYGTALAAHLVAEVSGEPWEDRLESSILGPLGMTRTTGRQPLPPDLARDLSKAYRAGPDGFTEVSHQFVTLAPAGGMVATTEDMARFMLAHLRDGAYDGARILEEATVARMRTRLHTHDPRLPGNAHGFWEGRANGVRFLYHAGDTSWYTLLVLVPEHDLGFYVAYNSPGGAVAREAFRRALLDHAFPRHDVAPEPGSEGRSSTLERLTGVFGTSRISTTSLTKVIGALPALTVARRDDVLVTSVPGVGTRRWVEVEPLYFAELGGDERLSFKLDARGRVERVFMSDLPLMAFVPIPWHGRPLLHGTLLVSSLLVLLSAATVWPFLARAARRRGRNGTGFDGRVRGVLTATSSVYLLFFVTFGVALLDATEIEFGLFPTLAVALALGGTAAVLAAGSVVGTVVAWGRRSGPVAERTYATCVAIACVALAWQLHYWNLLGVRL